MTDHRMGWPPLAAMIAEAFPQPGRRPLLGTPRLPVDQAARAELDRDPFPVEFELPEGVIEYREGSGYPKYEVQCCMCEKWVELPCDVSEIPQQGYEHYCGGSPRCCP